MNNGSLQPVSRRDLLEDLITALDNSVRVMITVEALGTGLVIPTLLLRLRTRT